MWSMASTQSKYCSISQTFSNTSRKNKTMFQVFLCLACTHTDSKAMQQSSWKSYIFIDSWWFPEKCLPYYPEVASSNPDDANSYPWLGVEKSNIGHGLREKGVAYSHFLITHSDTSESWVSVSLYMFMHEVGVWHSPLSVMPPPYIAWAAAPNDAVS